MSHCITFWGATIVYRQMRFLSTAKLRNDDISKEPQTIALLSADLASHEWHFQVRVCIQYIQSWFSPKHVDFYQTLEKALHALLLKAYAFLTRRLLRNARQSWYLRAASQVSLSLHSLSL